MRETQLLANGRVLRYNFRERMVHWLAGLSYLYLLLTGLAFWSPWAFWIAAVLGGATVAARFHSWAGVIFTIAILGMYRLWGKQMRAAKGDKAWWSSLPHYIQNEDEEMPSADRFNPGQKLLFWGFYWCGIALLLSGLVLWFTEYVPWNLRFLRYISVVVHPVAALLTIGLFMVHVYMGTAAERGAFTSVIRGDVSPAWAKKHHRLWYEQIVKGASARK